MRLGKPEPGDIEKLVTALEYEPYSEIQTKFEEDERFYELNFQDLLQLPDEYRRQGIVLPTARDMVDTYVDHIDISNARVYVNKKSATNVCVRVRRVWAGTELESK